MNPSTSALKFPGGKSLSLASPVVMGVLNITPDSFSDGGNYLNPDDALRRADVMIAQGAAIIDIGGESSRPGAIPVSPEEEQARILPVVRKLAARVSVPLSIDTYHVSTARLALECGARMLNDITALRGDREMINVVRERDVPVVLMHMQGTPLTMQQRPEYGDVLSEVRTFFQERIDWLTGLGVDSSRLVLDPGIGFGKRLEDNLALLRHLNALSIPDIPIMVGLSRKSFVQKIDPRAVNPSDRLGGTLAATIAALLGGANIIRTHDVRETVQAIRVWQEISAA